MLFRSTMLQTAGSLSPEADALLRRITRLDQLIDSADQRITGLVDQRVRSILTRVQEEEGRVAGYRNRLSALEAEASTVVGNLILRQFRNVQVQLYQIVMRADLGLVDVAWEMREEHNNRARFLAEEQNREISQINDEFSEVTEGASPEDSQRLNGGGSSTNNSGVTPIPQTNPTPTSPPPAPSPDAQTPSAQGQNQ